MWTKLIEILTVVGLLFGGYFYIDANYASASNVEQLRKEIKKDRIEDRRKSIEDKLFELEFKKKSTPREFKPIDDALLERFKRELRSLPRE